MSLEQAGIAAFGPSAAAARLEGSKLYAKEAMREAGVPTAEHTVAGSREEALEHLRSCAYPVVLKADGLAAGKGVIIAADEAEASEAVEAFFTEQRFGSTRVLIEEFLAGEELSLLAICDGTQRRPARAGSGLQADLRRRPRPEHRRDGQLLAGPGDRSRRRRGEPSPRSTSRSST